MKAFARPFIGGMERATLPPRPGNRGRLAQLATADRPQSMFPMPGGSLPVPHDHSRVPARPSNPASAELFELPMKCAKDDSPATLRFQQSLANPKHFYVRQVLACGTAGGRRISDPALAGVSNTSILFDDVQCVHCRAPGGTLYCYACRSLICRGGVIEEEHGVAVTCTPSCGSSGFLTVYRTETETVYRERICIGHIEPSHFGGTQYDLDRALARRPGRFFDCCDRCDAPTIISKRAP